MQIDYYPLLVFPNQWSNNKAIFGIAGCDWQERRWQWPSITMPCLEQRSSTLPTTTPGGSPMAGSTVRYRSPTSSLRTLGLCVCVCVTIDWYIRCIFIINCLCSSFEVKTWVSTVLNCTKQAVINHKFALRFLLISLLFNFILFHLNSFSKKTFLWKIACDNDVHHTVKSVIAWTIGVTATAEWCINQDGLTYANVTTTVTWKKKLLTSHLSVEGCLIIINQNDPYALQ